MKQFDAVVFDMDGLLLDTERVALVASEVACEKIGVSFSREVYEACVGTKIEKTREILAEALEGQCGVDEYFAVWNEEFRLLADNGIPLRPGVLVALNYFRDLGWPMGVATSSSTETAERHLNAYELIGYFEVGVGGDQVTYSKPDPEIFLLAAERLGKSPERCLAFEDSNNGARSAHAAGMTVVQIPDQVPTADDVHKAGVIILESLESVPGYRF